MPMLPSSATFHVLVFAALAIMARLASLVVSKRHEARLRAAGAVEYDSGTTRLLALLHTAFYLCGMAEALWKQAPVDTVTVVGMVLWLLSMAALVAVVRELKGLWTVKVLISSHHELKRGSLFRWIRHPNYFLNLLPELFGYALAMHAWLTLIVLMPLYGLVLARRIRAEEEALRHTFPEY